MPSRADIEAATPLCPARERTGPAARLAAGGGSWGPPCNLPLRSLSAVEKWSCETHGPSLSWADAGLRVQRFAGRMWFEEEAA